MRKILIVTGLALGAVACAGFDISPPRPKPAPTPTPDSCGAAKLRYLVGRNKSEIPAAKPGEARRVYCTTCAVTMDYSPARLDIVFDDKSGVIKEVKCG